MPTVLEDIPLETMQRMTASTPQADDLAELAGSVQYTLVIPHLKVVSLDILANRDRYKGTELPQPRWSLIGRGRVHAN